MSEPIDYAEMLEIPVNTLNVTKKRSRRHREADDLKRKAVEAVNERMEDYEAAESPRMAAGENVIDYGGEPEPPLEEELLPERKETKRFLENKLLIGEFIAVCALCAAILLTNLFWQNSAINTFFRNLITEDAPVAAVDERSYAELTPGSVVSDAAIVCSVSDTGVLSFTGACSVYAPYGGIVQNVAENEGMYTVEIRHTSTFSTVISGLTYAYAAAGDAVYATIPVGYSDGADPVSVSMYDDGSLIRAYSVNENNDIVWNV